MKKIRHIPTKDTSTRKKSSFLIILLFLVSCCFIVGYGFFYYKNLISKPQSTQDEIVYVNVQEGATRQSIANTMEDLQLISRADHLIWYMKISKQGGNIKAGNHILNKNMSIEEMVEALESPPDDLTVWVTLLEGLRHDEFAEKLDEVFSLSDNKQFDKQKFIDICENPLSYSEKEIPALYFFSMFFKSLGIVYFIFIIM